MRALGLTYVRVGDFTWSDIEPRPGEFDLGLAGRRHRHAGRRGSARRHRDADRRAAALADASVSGHSPGRSAKVAACVAARAGIAISPLPTIAARRPASAGSTPGATESIPRSPAGKSTTSSATTTPAAATVRPPWPDSEPGWKTATATIETLNDAWGTRFWSQRYTDWDEIDLPNLTVAGPNPSHLLDFYRFSSDLIAEFLTEHAAIIRAHSPNRWVTHNFMRFCDQFDHYPAAVPLDFVTWDSYPTGGVEYSDLSLAEKARWARTGEPDLVSVNHDLYRGMKPAPHHPWVMEQQAGQINWAPSNPLPADGAVDLWTAQTWAHGGACTSLLPLARLDDRAGADAFRPPSPRRNARPRCGRDRDVRA